jgi:hypothetical protein
MRSEAFCTDSASAAIRLMIIVTAFLAGGAVARKFGVPPHWGVLAALALVALGNMVLLLVQELPRQGLTFLRRWLMVWMWLIGCAGITWSALQVRYDQWAVLYGSLHVFTMLALTLCVSWVSAGREFAAVVFGRPAQAIGKRAKAMGNSLSVKDDHWLD